MRKEDMIKYSDRKNRNLYNSVEREHFVCMEINIPTGGNWMREACAYAQEIVPNLNPGQANSSEKREWSTVEIDNLSGMIAELACLQILRWKYGNENICKPPSDTSYNQVDLELYNGKTIEVRSSCVRNGIDFALFAQNRKVENEQYFDVIGPYSNEYKPGENFKDYYMRVLYECDKKNFMDLLAEPALKLYITGGATRGMMTNPEYYQLKHLTPAGGQVQMESDYRVIPLAKSLDVKEFFDVLQEENEKLIPIRI